MGPLAAIKQRRSELRLAAKGVENRAEKVFKRYTTQVVDGNYVFWNEVENLANGKAYTVDQL